MRRTHANQTDQHPDPFQERASKLATAKVRALGADILFESSSPSLLARVREAYDGLPRHRFPGPAPQLRIRLLLRSEDPTPVARPAGPRDLEMFSGGGWMGATSRGSDGVVLSLRDRTALVMVSPRTARSTYHTRYELIEFAVFTLASRCQHLVPLHGACVGYAGAGVLLMGPSGSGKSTVTMMSLMSGLDFLAEDAVFVAPQSLLATGVPNYLHVRSDSLKWLSAADQALLRRSPVIRRRSGVRKFEVDLRQGGYRLAPRPLKISAVVFLAATHSPAGRLLRPISKRQLLLRAANEQAYAANLPQWRPFSSHLSRLPAFELRRGEHPAESVAAIRTLLGAR
jgi:hypothetical protein